MRLPVGRGWQPVMLEDKILVAEQSMTWQLKRSCDLQHSTLMKLLYDSRKYNPSKNQKNLKQPYIELDNSDEEKIVTKC